MSYKEPWSWETDLSGGAKSDNTTNTETWISADGGSLIICTIEVDTPRFSREDFARRIMNCVNSLVDIEDPEEFVAAAIAYREKMETIPVHDMNVCEDDAERERFDAAAGSRLFQVK